MQASGQQSERRTSVDAPKVRVTMISSRDTVLCSRWMNFGLSVIRFCLVSNFHGVQHRLAISAKRNDLGVYDGLASS